MSFIKIMVHDCIWKFKFRLTYMYEACSMYSVFVKKSLYQFIDVQFKTV